MNPIHRLTARDEHGTVLLLVTWILLIMGSVALFLLYRSGAEWAIMSSFSRRLQLQGIAEARLQECILELNSDKTDSDDKTDDWYFGGRIEEEREGAQVTVIIEDEGSKPNINFINYYANLVQIVPAEVSTDPLIDWMSRNPDPLPNGAKDSYYQSLSPPYKCRSGFISSLEEIKEIKDGDKLYPKLAPEFTVFGKANLNIINVATFTSLLFSHGFDKYWIEKVADDFTNLVGKGERSHFFTKADDFTRLSSVNTLDCDKLRPLFRFDGFCNVNFISLKGLKFVLAEAEMNPDTAKQIIDYREQHPFKSLDDLQNYLISQAQPKNQGILVDYFTVVSTIIRYKIWVTYQQSTYYLDTVWERSPVTNAKTKWQAHPLSWRVLINTEAPDIPSKDDKENDDKDNPESSPGSSPGSSPDNNSK